MRGPEEAGVAGRAETRGARRGTRSERQTGPGPVGLRGSGARVQLFFQVQREALDLGFKTLTLAAVCFKNPLFKEAVSMS